ncbi:MAG: helix-hairpin-helix domain-containing protein [Bdellovibrionota bacterium]
MVPDVASALTGAADILAERINETAEIRSAVRDLSYQTAKLVSTLSEGSSRESEKDKKKRLENSPKYQNYFEYQESLADAASHRVMAIFRGEKENILRVNIEVDGDKIINLLTSLVVGEEQTTPEVSAWIAKVAEDAYRRLISPSIETEFRMNLKRQAEDEAIKVFSTNLENLLLLPPIPGKPVLGIDPGMRTGSKLAVVSDTGKVLDYNTVYPTPGKTDTPKSKEAIEVIAGLIQKYQVECVAIGNGTGSREIDQIVLAAIKEKDLKGVKRAVVNEAGASVYSTENIAREEFPDLDPTIRSTISIARRLQDPLAELVKIEPRSIGVGQYQHDCNVSKLSKSLKETVESCVNRVGVNVNTASHKLLSYVSGISSTLAKNIVDHRDKNGKFSDRGEIKKVQGFGPKAFEQSAGFLRVPDSSNCLDNSAVHPERYDIVYKIAEDIKTDVSAFVGKASVVHSIDWSKYVSDEVGRPTLDDIAAELIKPGRDPREDGARLMFSDDVSTIEDLKQDMKLKGTVTNVTNFGAFVDIGVHQDGLVHISQLSDEFVSDPASVVSVGDVLNVRVLEVDIARKRISLSCKSGASSTQAANSANSQANGALANKPHASRQASQGEKKNARGVGGANKNNAARSTPFTAADLMAKFNARG